MSYKRMLEIQKVFEQELLDEFGNFLIENNTTVCRDIQQNMRNSLVMKSVVSLASLCGVHIGEHLTSFREEERKAEPYYLG